jgi:tRNA (cytidine/uridine-2'-O-)-methyltransferase
MKSSHDRRCRLPFEWPDPPFNVALVEPEIPPNTGNIARLCAATGTPLHLVGVIGFRLNNAALRRAGLDYWESVDLRRHAALDEFMRSIPNGRFHLFSTAGNTPYTSAAYRPGDYLIFGNESKGLPADLLAAYPEKVLGIPVQPERVRSLNLATAAGIALYEALRQCQGN